MFITAIEDAGSMRCFYCPDEFFDSVQDSLDNLDTVLEWWWEQESNDEEKADLEIEPFSALQELLEQ